MIMSKTDTGLMFFILTLRYFKLISGGYSAGTNNVRRDFNVIKSSSIRHKSGFL